MWIFFFFFSSSIVNVSCWGAAPICCLPSVIVGKNTNLNSTDEAKDQSRPALFVLFADSFLSSCLARIGHTYPTDDERKVGHNVYYHSMI